MMRRERQVYDRLLFGTASAWNLAAALMLLVNPDFLLARLGIEDPAARLLARSFASSVGTWGIGYGLIAVDARRFRDFAWLGAISKTIFFLIYAAAYLTGRIGGPGMAPAVVDLIFAALFLEFLFRTRRKPETH
ncbi:MAG: hypothetical protein IPM66_17320 [Acidobacteriota bacterium]|nr:MAG: hypothetical protein IPM66_17320 [Acidobacteriota bacterium]